MKSGITLIILYLLVISCKDNVKEAKPSSGAIVPNLIVDFEMELNNLSTDEIVSIDKASSLFQEFIRKTNNINQKDSLFQPYFDFYNIGSELLKKKPEETILNYGFQKIYNDNIGNILPTQSEYLETNIILHLSLPMQKFCRQQLKEFTDPLNLETIAANTIWWENFNVENQDFFLKEMTEYHYKQWHLKNLLTGTRAVKIYTEDGRLSSQAKKIYENIVENHSSSKTAEVIEEYLSLLNQSNMEKTVKVIDFINNYK